MCLQHFEANEKKFVLIFCNYKNPGFDNFKLYFVSNLNKTVYIELLIISQHSSKNTHLGIAFVLVSVAARVQFTATAHKKRV